MLTLKFSKPSYAIEKDGKTTVCIYYCEIYDTETKKTFCTFTAVGKSTCTENDTFDTKVGEDITIGELTESGFKAVFMGAGLWDIF